MIYGHRWTSSYGEKDDGTWLEGLRGLTATHLAKGINRMINRCGDWPPTLPVFRRLCMDHPDMDEAIDRAMRQTCSGPVPKAMRRKIGSWDLNHLPERELRRKLESVYNETVAQVEHIQLKTAYIEAIHTARLTHEAQEGRLSGDISDSEGVDQG